MMHINDIIMISYNDIKRMLRIISSICTFAGNDEIVYMYDIQNKF